MAIDGVKSDVCDGVRFGHKFPSQPPDFSPVHTSCEFKANYGDVTIGVRSLSNCDARKFAFHEAFAGIWTRLQAIIWGNCVDLVQQRCRHHYALDFAK